MINATYFQRLEKTIAVFSSFSSFTASIYLGFYSSCYSFHSDLLPFLLLHLVLFLFFALPILAFLYYYIYSPLPYLRILLLVFHLTVLFLLIGFANLLYQCEVGLYDWVFQNPTLSLRRFWSADELYLRGKRFITALNDIGVFISPPSLAAVERIAQSCTPSGELFLKEMEDYVRFLQRSDLGDLALYAGAALAAAIMVAIEIATNLLHTPFPWSACLLCLNTLNLAICVRGLEYIAAVESVEHLNSPLISSLPSDYPVFSFYQFFADRPFSVLFSSILLLVLVYLLQRTLTKKFPRL